MTAMLERGGDGLPDGEDPTGRTDPTLPTIPTVRTRAEGRPVRPWSPAAAAATTRALAARGPRPVLAPPLPPRPRATPDPGGGPARAAAAVVPGSGGAAGPVSTTSERGRPGAAEPIRRGTREMEPAQYLAVLRARWLSIGVLALVGLVLAAVVTARTTQQYRATTTVFFSLERGETVGELVQGANYTQELVQSYAEVATMSVVLDPVIRDLGLDTTASRLAGTITADAPLDTVLIRISATDPDPGRATDVANAVGSQLATAVEALSPRGPQESTPINVTVTEPAQVPRSPIAPRVKLNLAAGLGLGLAAGIGLALLREAASGRGPAAGRRPGQDEDADPHDPHDPHEAHEPAPAPGAAVAPGRAVPAPPAPSAATPPPPGPEDPPYAFRAHRYWSPGDAADADGADAAAAPSRVPAGETARRRGAAGHRSWLSSRSGGAGRGR